MVRQILPGLDWVALRLSLQRLSLFRLPFTIDPVPGMRLAGTTHPAQRSRKISILAEASSDGIVSGTARMAFRFGTMMTLKATKQITPYCRETKGRRIGVVILAGVIAPAAVQVYKAVLQLTVVTSQHPDRCLAGMARPCVCGIRDIGSPGEVYARGLDARRSLTGSPLA